MLAWVDGLSIPTYGLTDLYIRIGSWEAYWHALRPFTIW
jgi:hypothetical protein